jgi:XTP/dITP diphosphohydrolase
VVFHAAIAEGDPDEPFGIDDVAGGLVDKLIHRHPHIFGDESAETPEQVQANWIRLKGVEKARESVTDGVPLASPALALAAKLAGRARQAGLPLPVTPPAPLYDDETALGDHLLAEAAAAQASGIDPEAALRHAARRYRTAVRAAESDARARRGDPNDRP